MNKNIDTNIYINNSNNKNKEDKKWSNKIEPKILNKDYSNFEQEKKLFFEIHDRIMNDSYQIRLSKYKIKEKHEIIIIIQIYR